MLLLPWRRNARTTAPARITAAALVGSAATVAALFATNVIPVPTWALPGIDVASHQHPGGSAIDWNAVAASGQKFAFVKATEGTGYTNPFFVSDSIKAQQAGIVPGSYHYAKPGQTDPRAEARFYASALTTGPQPSLPPTLDLEENGGLDPTALQNWVREWIDEIKTLTGRDPILYTYHSFWIQSMGNTTEFSEYPLWLAYYDSNLPNQIPGGWKEVTFWQYTGSGNAAGVQTQVDLNEYYGSDEQLQQLAGKLSAKSQTGKNAEALKPVRDVVKGEADVVNKIEHLTGVDIPLTTDFVMLLLGVIGGRVSPETLITQGAQQLQNGNLGSSEGVGAQADQVSGSIKAGQEGLAAITALAKAFQEFNKSGGQVPLDALLPLLQGQAAKGGNVDVSQLLKLLQQYGNTQNWNAKLQNGQVAADPNAMQELATEASKATPTPAGKKAAQQLPQLIKGAGAQAKAPAAPKNPAAPSAGAPTTGAPAK